MASTDTPTDVGATPRGNPRDSMKSTWRTDKSQWGPLHFLFSILQVHQAYPDKQPPVHSKKDPVPHVPEWNMQRHVIFHAGLPLLIHQLYCWVTGHNLGMVAALLLYTGAFKLIGIHQLHQLRRMGLEYGFLDGDKHPRDDVPDHSVGRVFISLLNTSTVRSVFTILLAYKKSVQPIGMNWAMLPLEIGLYGIILDFWFYWYHRVMHENDSLWKYHRTHHLTKHPNPLLTLYADTEQEIFDIAGIPLLTYFTMKFFGLPMGFYEWWMCHQYVMFAELSGHSGLRIHARPPSTLGWLLKLMDCDLVIEDHDLHHRRGWKRSGNYGKQTRLWDTIFGTKLDRIETTPENIDYNKTAAHPLF